MSFTTVGPIQTIERGQFRVAKSVTKGLNGTPVSNRLNRTSEADGAVIGQNGTSLSEEQRKAMAEVERQHGFAPGQIDALNNHYDFQSNGFTWHLVHEALVIAVGIDKSSNPPMQLVRSFVRQLEQAIAECVEPKKSPEEAALVITATGLMWRYVHSNLLVALMSPGAIDESPRVVRSFVERLEAALVDWAVLAPEELKRSREDWNIYRAKVLMHASRTRVAPAATWLFVHAALDAAAPRYKNLLSIRPFADEVKEALIADGVLTLSGELLEDQSVEEHSAVAIKAPAQTWCQVHAVLVTLSSQLTGQSVRLLSSFAEELGLALVKWGVRTPDDLRKYSESYRK